MPDTVTPILGLTKPEVGGSANTWGNKLNGDLDIIDSKMIHKKSGQWDITLGDGNTSAGPFVISRYDNASVKIDEPMVINRQTGDVTFLKNVFSNSPGGFFANVFGFVAETGLYFYRAAAGKISFTGRLLGNGAVPPGAIMDFGMASPPDGWLVCDGQAVSRTTYADLFAAIGGTWGVGDGSTTFNLPPAASRFRRHRDGGVLAGNVGNTQGPNNLSHSHTGGGATGAADRTLDHNHAINFGSQNDSPDHAHNVTAVTYSPSVAGISTGGVAVQTAQTTQATSGATARHTHAIVGGTGGNSISLDHLHGFSFTTSASGDGNEARPYSITVLTCIKT